MNAELRNTISRYFAEQPVMKAWVFGSFSRGEETPMSDIDIMVVLDPKQKVGLKFFQMREDLTTLLRRNVDLVTEASILPFARENAEHDRLLVYERGN